MLSDKRFTIELYFSYLYGQIPRHIRQAKCIPSHNTHAILHYRHIFTKQQPRTLLLPRRLLPWAELLKRIFLVKYTSFSWYSARYAYIPYLIDFENAEFDNYRLFISYWFREPPPTFRLSFESCLYFILGFDMMTRWWRWWCPRISNKARHSFYFSILAAQPVSPLSHIFIFAYLLILYDFAANFTKQ